MNTTDLVHRARATGTPLLEPDGDLATFLWRGKTAPQLIGDFNGWEPGGALPLEPAGDKLWACELHLPRQAYMEYGFIWPGHTVHRTDPLNTRTVENGLGQLNSWFYMPEGSPTPLGRRQPGVARGTLTRHVITLSAPAQLPGGRRAVYLYQPPTPDPCPLLVVYDGPDYRRRAQLLALVENLAAQRRIRPVALALLPNGGQARHVEYACSDTTLAFVAQHVLPLAQQTLRLTDPAEADGSYGVLGASMGGLMAVYTGLRLPHVFGRVLAQSGAYAYQGWEHIVFPLVEHWPPPPTRLWLDVGLYDLPGLLDGNRRMQAALTNRGYAVAYREYPAGHNYPAWRDELWRGLEWLFAPEVAHAA